MSIRPTSTYSHPGFRKKLVYGMIIVVLFGVMFPYTERLAVVKKERDLGEAAIGQIDTGSFMMKLFLLGGFRGIVADYLWNRAEEYKKRARLGPAGADGRDDHQAPAPLPGDLDLPELEPGVQRRRRVGRARGQVPVDQEGDPVRPAGGRRRTRRSPDLIWDTAWYYYHKLGFSDESIILRRLFRDDEDTDFKRYYDPEREAGGRRRRQLQAGLRLVQPGGPTGRLGRGEPAARRHGRDDPVRRPHAAAEGPPRRHRLPLDAGARPDPLRRRRWRR